MIQPALTWGRHSRNKGRTTYREPALYSCIEFWAAASLWTFDCNTLCLCGLVPMLERSKMATISMVIHVVCLILVVSGQFDLRCDTNEENPEYEIEAATFDRRHESDTVILSKTGKVYVNRNEPIVVSSGLKLFPLQTASYDNLKHYMSVDNCKLNSSVEITAAYSVLNYDDTVSHQFFFNHEGNHVAIELRNGIMTCPIRYTNPGSIESLIFYKKGLIWFTKDKKKMLDSRQDTMALHEFVPTAMVNIRTPQTDTILNNAHLLVLFFGPFHVSSSTRLLELNTPFEEVIKKSRRVHLNNGWIGCPPDFCFEFNIDAAYCLDDHTIILMSGTFDHSIDHWPPRVVPILSRKRSWPKGSEFEMDRIIPIFAYKSRGDVIYGVRGHRNQYMVTIEMNSTQHIIKMTKDDEDIIRNGWAAAVNINEEVEYLEGNPGNISLKRIVRNILGSDIDASFSYNQTVVIITGNYYYNISFQDVDDGKKFSGPFAIFSNQYLSNCYDSKYINQHYRKYLNVSSKKDFYGFVNRFIDHEPFDPPATATTTGGTTPSGHQTTERTDTTTVSAGWSLKKNLMKPWAIVSIAILAACLAILIAILIYLLLKKKKQDEPVTITESDLKAISNTKSFVSKMSMIEASDIHQK